MDWYSRKILSWELSITMDKEFCISVLDRALRLYGKPEIFNSDQGSQFTSHAFQKLLLDRNIKISMDGKGRALDNIVIERFWRTLKYGEVYLKNYETPMEAADGINNYIEKYNSRRPHTANEKRTPDEAYFLNSSGLLFRNNKTENQIKKCS
jgi:putative transposase